MATEAVNRSWEIDDEAPVCNAVGKGISLEESFKIADEISEQTAKVLAEESS